MSNHYRTFFAIMWITSSVHAAVIFVDDDAAPAGDGQSWQTAFDDLQDALSTAMTGD
jgi:hypothetical protein